MSDQVFNPSSPKMEDQTKLINISVGMLFPTEEDAYNHYASYAAQRGFTIRKHTTRRSKVDKHLYYRSIVCSNQGVKSTHDRAKYKKPDVRTNCEARMIVRLANNNWKVTDFDDEHNHPIKGIRACSEPLSMSTTSMISKLKTKTARLIEEAEEDIEFFNELDEWLSMKMEERKRKKINDKHEEKTNYEEEPSVEQEVQPTPPPQVTCVNHVGTLKETGH